jgi:hypothetical protein
MYRKLFGFDGRLNNCSPKVSLHPIKILVFAVVAIILPTAGIASHVYGTNESSYKYGYQNGKDEWTNCTDFDADCNDGLSDCQSPVITYDKNMTTGYQDIEIKHYNIMTNQTACIDGYVHAWNHVCKQPQAKDNSVHCPTTFADESNNDTLSTPPTTGLPKGTTIIPAHVDKRAGYNATGENTSGTVGQGQGKTTGGFIFNPPVTLAQENAQNRDIHSSFELLGGTLSNGTQSVDRTRVWNFVNETNNGTVVAKGKMIIGLPGAGGTGAEIVNHKIIWQGELWYDPSIPGNSSLTHVVEMVNVWKKNLCCIHPSVLYTLKVFSTNHVQLTNGQILDDDDRFSGIQNNTIDMTLVKSIDHHWS